MDKIFNPFRHITGTKALVMGLIFIVATSLIEWSNGLAQDSYIHYTYSNATLWRVVALDLFYWLLPALLLYVCGLILSRSQIRLVDVFGTAAFAKLLLLPMLALQLLPCVQTQMKGVVDAIMAGAQPTGVQMTVTTLYGIWALAWLILYYVWAYNGYATSCNVRGWRAVLLFVLVQIVVTIASTLWGSYLL